MKVKCKPELLNGQVILLRPSEKNVGLKEAVARSKYHFCSPHCTQSWPQKLTIWSITR